MANRKAYYDALESFKTPKSQVNVENLARGLCLYTRIVATDAFFLSSDSLRRDELYNQLKDDPRLAPNWLPETLVPVEKGPEGVDEYLAVVDDEIAQRTPPATYEVCVRSG